ncbi:glycosyltransferase family 4 protein [Flavobacterium sp. SM2513]|uniref:glycosyltransferase family 4 protein n=1 Tax=Flavobacterium sp. SM2513 TaxID=3424766 RepID=UPI003D7FBEDF
MRVLIVNNYQNNSIGGVEHYLQTLVSYAEENHPEITFKWFGVKDKRTKMYQKFYNAATTKAIIAEIDTFKPDLINSFSIGATVTPHFMWFAKSKSIPIIQSFRDYYYICPKTYMLDMDGKLLHEHTGFLDCVLNHYPKKNIFYDSILYLRQSYHKAIIKKNIDYFLTPSQNLTQLIASEFGIKGETLPNPVLISNPFVGEQKSDYLLFVGRLDAEKGVFTLLKSFQKIVEKYPDEQLKIAGSGRVQAELEKFTTENNIQNVDFLGAKNKEELMRLYASAKFIIVPSEILESYGNVILESFAFHKTVIISNLLGIQKEVEESQSGLIFPYGDVEQLTEAIEKLLTNEILRKELEQNASNFVQNLSFENHFKELQMIYNKVLKK